MADLSTGDSVLMEGIAGHLDAHLGKGGQVFHELVSPTAHIDVYPHPATPSRPFHVIATTGMAEHPMQLPAGSSADTHVELVLLLPQHWPLDVKSWQDERHYWPLRWLKRVARFHYESGHWLGEGHVLTHGPDPAPIHPAYPFDSVLLAQPRAMRRRSIVQRWKTANDSFEEGLYAWRLHQTSRELNSLPLKLTCRPSIPLLRLLRYK